jgi:DNA-binding NarL/FixJ family response regulator
MTPRVLIVDDQPLTREALAGLLGSSGFAIAGWAGDGRVAIERATELQPDLIVLDLTMPEMGGLTALPLLRRAAPEAEIVVLTASEDDGALLAAIRGGASGYLLKTESPDRIVGFLQGVFRGETALSGAVARRLFDQVREGGRADSAVPESIAAAVSARELEVLLLLDQHLATEEIASRLFISEHTVRSHVKNLLAKLNVSSRREALEKLSAARRA